MSTAIAQKAIQGAKFRILRLTIPAEGAAVTLLSLIEANVRMTEQELVAITSVRILANTREAGPAFVARPAIAFGDIVSDLQGGAPAGATMYIAAVEVANGFIEAMAGPGFAIACEVTIS
jgi:hypothetical protein